MKPTAIIFIVLFLLSKIVSATVRNVPSTYASIAAALSAADPGDTILVDQGTYNENIVWPSKNDLKLISTTGPSNTIINGNGNGSVIRMNFYGTSVTIDTNTVIDGFQITGGYLNSPLSLGAGIYLQGSSPLIMNLEIHDNIMSSVDSGMGGGICCRWYSSPVIANCVIRNNSITADIWAEGGGIYMGNGSNVTVRNSDIIENVVLCDREVGGGGISISENSLTSIFKCNVLRNSTDGTSSFGSGIFVKSLSTIDSCLIEGNNSFGRNLHYGAGIYVNSGVTISNSKISGNSQFGTSPSPYGTTTFYGAGIACRGGTGYHTNIRNCKIEFNKMIPDSISGSIMKGAGISTDYSEINMRNSIVAGNSMEGNSLHTYKGSGIYGSGGIFSVYHSTIADNYVNNDSANLSNAISVYNSTLHMYNSISWNPDCKFEFDSLTYMHPAMINSDVRNIIPSGGNISADPLFIGANDYHLSSLSPCLGAGFFYFFLIIDLDGFPRPMPAGTNPDMGPYENDQPVGVNNFEKDNQSSVFPNPVDAESLISLRDLNDRIVQVEIYNGLGQLEISKSGLSSNTYNLNSVNLKSGVYFYQLRTRSGKSLNGKFIID